MNSDKKTKELKEKEKEKDQVKSPTLEREESVASATSSTSSTTTPTEDINIATVDVDYLRKNVVQLNDRLESLIKATNEFCKAGAVFSDKAKVFLDELGHYGGADTDPRTKKIVEVVKQLEKMKSGLLQKTEVLLSMPMQTFLDTDLKPALGKENEMKRSKKERDKALQKMNRHKDPYRQKQLQVKYTEAQNSYDLANFEYVCGMKAVDDKKWFHLNNWLTTYFFANVSHFKRAQQFLAQYELEFQTNTKKIFKEETEIEEESKKIELDTKKNIFKAPPRSDKEKQGYLQTKGKHLWFVLIDGFVSFYKSWQESVPIHSFDLLTCTVKSSSKLTFELISPEETYQLKAASQEELEDWMKVIRAGISFQLEAHKKNRIARTNDNSLIAQIQKQSEANAFCADCGAKTPDWAVINLGVIICYECSGVHRGLGTHISKVRSLTLDRWEPQIFQLMKFIGNENANRIYEAAIPKDYPKLSPDSDRSHRETFINEKYSRKLFVKVPSDLTFEEISKRIYMAAMNGENDEIMVPTVLELLAFGGNINWVNVVESNTTALHCLAAIGNLVGLELLLQNGANLSITDNKGWTPIHYAAYHDRVNCARLLLNRGSIIDARDMNGQTPLDLAVNNNCEGVKRILEAQQTSFSSIEEDDSSSKGSPLNASSTT
eukprot:TRINITY_DN277_c5_g1_i1.p1 TRINITY_DN277_c5_g1~~TRINITY_DN277_c5_g1_i1.p1  ORF type:complete len:662 (+),score=136.02 TRINITY_DN277_c5_g1_i1:85-2070(+)